ncbi:SCO family protein [Natronococcus pandeyae]|uniref:SCO family protein n=1 Tax=Natronococcus pandeyae TaxID=2055836 RepID=A0A8J8TR38_9EURY|nr:SCO family protein [Natronococcus pandeyae]TYL37555.1 SCO family protein [Natronococcus pandeyae]
MKRRAYLGTLGGAGAVGLSGCLGDLPVVGDSETALDPPDHPRGEPSHPIHGDAFPTFTLPDPHEGTDVSLADFEGERSYLLTFIYTSCTEDCGALTKLLQLVQEDAAEQGYDDDLALLAMTFDPETDDAEALREYGEQYGVDIEADNWHFLRPETNEEAMSLLNDDIGVPAQVGGHDHGDDGHDHDDGHDDHDDHEDEGHEDDEQGHEDDHDDHAGDDHGESDHEDGEHEHGDDHDHEDDAQGDGNADDSEDDGDDHDHSEDIHYYIAFLVNEQGIVERSYPNATDGRDETRPQAIIDDVRTVVE